MKKCISCNMEERKRNFPSNYVYLGELSKQSIPFDGLDSGHGMWTLKTQCSTKLVETITPVHIVNTVFLVLVQTVDAFALLPRSSYIARGRSRNVELAMFPFQHCYDIGMMLYTICLCLYQMWNRINHGSKQLFLPCNKSTQKGKISC